MDTIILNKSLEKVEKIAGYSKLRRMMVNPMKYIRAIAYRELIYRFTKREKKVEALTFFDKKMKVALPAGTDIYLTGGKSHDSEIRLAKFLINQLKPGQTFVDIGAHFGYFSLLASKLVMANGQVFSFEPSENSYHILKMNTEDQGNISIYNKAVSLDDGFIEFNEFPNLYSEYSSIDVEQFKNESWYKENPPLKRKIESVRLDHFVGQNAIIPDLIKIDVEGAEYDVIRGSEDFLSSNNISIIMEYLSAERDNIQHQKAHTFLKELGFSSFSINSIGETDQCLDIEKHLKNVQLDSDNMVFIK